MNLGNVYFSAITKAILINALAGAVLFSSRPCAAALDSSQQTLKKTSLNADTAFHPSAPSESDTLTTIIAPQRDNGVASLAQAGLDSAKKAFIRDSLIAEKVNYMRSYQLFPVSLDSLYNPSRLYRHTIFTSDAISISDLVQMYPQIVQARYSLSNSLNRYMPYGFPLPANGIYANGELIPGIVHWFNGSDRIAATQLSDITFAPTGRLHVTENCDELVVPEAAFLWENGLFYENILTLRVARPLSPNLSFAFFSNSRYFKSLKYYTRGDVKPLYEYFVHDTSLLSMGGQNPLVREQDSWLRIASKGKNGEQRYFSIGYGDDQNEVSRPYRDTIGNDSLKWDRIFRFNANAIAGINNLRLNGVFLDAECKLVREGHTRHDLSTNLERFGRNNEYSLAAKPYLSLRGDTASVAGMFTRHEETLYDNSKRLSYEGNAAVAYARHFSLLNNDGEVSGRLGSNFLDIHDVKSGNDWTAAVSARMETRSLLVRLFALRDCAAYPLLYDTVKEPFTAFFNFYESYGVEVYLTYKKTGIMTGLCEVTGPSAGDSSQVWPDNILPYQQPRICWVVAPMAGQWHGLSVASRWMFSDARPYLKARANLSYRAHPLNGREHLLVDLAFDYWSRRDTLTYGGANDWNREVLDLSLKAAVQIKTFSLFYKIDNVLNRNYAYIPGYRMPGITFRWGFQWLIQG